MNVQLIHDPDRIRPLHVVMIIVVAMTLGGGSLLLSASDAPIPVDGAVEWQEGSLLRAFVEVLCLNFQFPTNHAGDVKSFILAVGACLGILAVSIATLVRSPTDEAEASAEDPSVPVAASEASGAVPTDRKAHIAPLVAAQLMCGLYLLWSFASSRWSSAPDLAVGASVLLTIYFVWSFALGRGLSPAAALIASRIVFIIAAITSAMAIWYYFGRNPYLRAKFPFGNPTFLAAALIPGIVLGLSLGIESALRAVRERRRQPIVLLCVVLVGLAVCVWAFALTGSRGAAVGLALGGLGMAFFALRGRAKVVPILLATGLLVVGWVYFIGLVDAPTAGGRGATARLRVYSWSYAWRMYTEQPLRGHGQAGFALMGDSYAADDVLEDPEVFNARIAHAHNEWLEVMANLGSIGIALIATALLLTLAAGEATLATAPPSSQRWALIGLMGALVGLIAEEALGVGLRTGGLPLVFFTVVGLIWALGGQASVRSERRVRVGGARRWVLGLTGIGLGLSCLALARQDFVAARNGFLMGESFYTENLDETIRLAERATRRLSPQRALTHLFRLSEAHLRAAEFLQARARDRQQRAYDAEPPIARLLALAEDDYRLSDLHCEEGSGWLKRLIERSPGFVNHGRLAHRFSLARAYNAAAHSDREKQQALLQNAVISIERELTRQPFDASIAAEYVGALLAAGDPLPPLADVTEILARPLRRGRITRPYIDVLRGLGALPGFDAEYSGLIKIAQQELRRLDASETATEPVEMWAGEQIRLAATFRFLVGDYQGARTLLESAIPAYERLAVRSPYGAASFYAELADSRFYSDPTDPSAALASAQRAIALAPASLLGRKLRYNVESRRADYLLASGREKEAAQELHRMLPTGMEEKLIRREVGVRYTQLGESLLNTLPPADPKEPWPAEILERVQYWAQRALTLNAEDPEAYFAAANLMWRMRDDAKTGEHLREALRLGLAPSLVEDFVAHAIKDRPDSASMKALWKVFEDARAQAQQAERVPALIAPSDDTSRPTDSAPPP